MKYLEVQQARELSGLRLALTAQVPAPYSMSARAILDHHGVEYVAVEQVGGGANEELVAWTGHRNAPVAIYDSEAPRVGWLDILNLAERLGHGPTLLPEDIDVRMEMIGMINELIGENGWVWNLRILMLGMGGPERSARAAERNPMYKDYGYRDDARDAALEKARTVLARFTRFAQGSTGHYLCGAGLSAIDIYWVYFSNLLQPFSEEICPMPGGLRKSYEYSGELLSGFDSALIEHRDFILAQHLSSPMEF